MSGDGTRRRRAAALGLVVALTVAACGDGDGGVVARSDTFARASATSVPATAAAPAIATTTVAPTTTVDPSPTAADPSAAPAGAGPAPTAAPTTTLPPRPHTITETGFAPYASASGLVLVHPAAQIERIGFHQSTHDGARQQETLATAANPMTLPSRGRATESQTAADIVTPPGVAIYAPVTGTVIRGGGYTLYCDTPDEFLVIEPDGRPGFEVKMLHMVGLTVQTGQRVDAGVTQVARESHRLPFESQVDDHTGQPAWGHVHIEVVDTAIPDIPGGGGGC